MATTVSTTRIPSVSRLENGEVVDADVGVVFGDMGGGFGEGIGPGEGVAVQELQPGATLGEGVEDRRKIGPLISPWALIELPYRPIGL
uniref:Uncharacterized protein n=1 Tax=Kalanchoe fedtschenkoi TaxID=63787 RepID=A0A7N0VK03_KALFE